MRFPTNGELIELRKKEAESNEEDGFDQVVGFLASLGLPEKVALDMQPDHLLLVMETFSDGKKN